MDKNSFHSSISYRSLQEATKFQDNISVDPFPIQDSTIFFTEVQVLKILRQNHKLEYEQWMVKLKPHLKGLKKKPWYMKVFLHQAQSDSGFQFSEVNFASNLEFVLFHLIKENNNDRLH